MYYRFDKSNQTNCSKVVLSRLLRIRSTLKPLKFHFPHRDVSFLKPILCFQGRFGMSDDSLVEFQCKSGIIDMTNRVRKRTTHRYAFVFLY